MKHNGLSKIIAPIAMMAAIAIAIIVYSLAWFSVNGPNFVTAKSKQMKAAQVDALYVDINVPDSEYVRYMGETGLEYDGLDSPYSLVYTPFNVNISMLDGGTGLYFVYRMLDTSYIQEATDKVPSFYLTEEDLWDNFSMELHSLSYNESTETYSETGVVYRSENGYFRNVDNNEMLSLSNDQGMSFSLYVYFQGDVGMLLLHSTEADLDEAYEFDYDSPRYMFAYFALKSVFSMEQMHTLYFEPLGWNTDAPSETSLIDGAYDDLRAPSYYSYEYEVLTSGFNMLDGDGVAQTWPVAEVFTSRDMDTVATDVYFKDWVLRSLDIDEENPSDNGRYVYTTYRNTVSDNVDIKHMSTDPIRANHETLYATYGQSYEVTLDYNDETTEPSVAYIRPNAQYYSAGGHIANTNGTLTFYNPYGNVNVDEHGVVTPLSTSSIGVTDTFSVPTREGYRFLGWSTSSDSLVSPFTANSFTPTEDVTLYCIWQEVFDLTLVVPTTWSSYAIISNITITDGSTNYSGSTVVLPKEKGVTLYSLVSDITATATATIGVSTTRALSHVTWQYEENGQRVNITSSTTKTLDEDTTVYAVWSERKTYTVSVDLFESFKPPLNAITYTVTGRIAISEAVVIDGYTVTYNGMQTGTFTGSNSSTVTVANIPEGCTLADVLPDPTVSDASGGYAAAMYYFDNWTSDDNNWEGTTLANKQKSINQLRGTSAFTDTFIAGLTDNKIYAFFDRRGSI